jgi:hypothetical protein
MQTKEITTWQVGDLVKVYDTRYYGWDGCIVKLIPEKDMALIRPVNRCHSRCFYVSIEDLD